MENENWMKRSMDDVVFDGRNKTYGAFQLRQLYDKHMTRAMIVGMLLFLLAVSTPNIIQFIKEYYPEDVNAIKRHVVDLIEPPPIDALKPPPPPPPAVEPPPIKNQIKFVPPVVVPDDEKIDEPSPPTIDELNNKVIATQTIEGNKDGVDNSFLDEPPPAPAVLDEPSDEKPFTYVEQMPTFPDGLEAMYKYIYENIKYPTIAFENRISGQVIVQFVVSRDGEIQNAKVVKGIGGGCNEEALRMVNGMPRWKPGKHNGRAVPVTFRLPITFVLQ